MTKSRMESFIAAPLVQTLTLEKFMIQKGEA